MHAEYEHLVRWHVPYYTLLHFFLFFLHHVFSKRLNTGVFGNSSAPCCKNDKHLCAGITRVISVHYALLYGNVHVFRRNMCPFGMQKAAF